MSQPMSMSTVPRRLIRVAQLRYAAHGSRMLATTHAWSDSHRFQDTLNLPQTSFPNRSSPELIESTILPQTTTLLYEWNKAEPTTNDNLYILHDGPPYANGELHLGHALNKILKDFINRHELMMGKKIFYRPGWDCHGLPIELKALEKLNAEKKQREKALKKQIKKNPQNVAELEHELASLKQNRLSPLEIRKLASNHADMAIESQRKGFINFGVMGDWANPYITKDKDYVITQLKIFKQLFDRGLIHRQDKPVYWGCENASALAEGELEYNEQHKSTAVYVKFPITSTTLWETDPSDPVQALIWTSTPWTLPANQAICVNPDMQYCVVESQQHGKLLVAQDLMPQLQKIDASMQQTGLQFQGSQLVAGMTSYSNPLTGADATLPILGAKHVTNSAGTGLVHTAPGHGHDDYLVCLQHGIKTYSPVDDHGRYTDELPPCLHDTLLHKKVLTEGNPLVIERLGQNAMLFHVHEYTHSYPYDWRSKKPIIIRSTPQWFINVDMIKDDTIEALQKVDFYPERGSKRLVSFIKTRNEWCISRQRSWGVPIPVLYESETGKPLLTDESIDKIIEVISSRGPDAWFDDANVDVDSWLPQSEVGKSFYKGRDTMDVWFDSGSSWSTVENHLAQEGVLAGRDYLADVYLEGSDQHRGWFQSSLLTKIAVDSKVLPYKKIVTHGFLLDEKGNKMSKSLGNTLSPQMVIDGDKGTKLPKLGIDGLRLWVAQADYSTDISVGPTILSRVADNLKKIRFTLKFLLGNLQAEFQPVRYEELSALDRYVLSSLTRTTQQDILGAYRSFNYSKIVRELNLSMNVLLSSIYFDISKDSLYTARSDSHRRRSILTVLAHVYRAYVSVLSPIVPVITQEAWNHTPAYLKPEAAAATPFHAGWYALPARFVDAELEKEFDLIWEVRDKVKMLLDRGSRLDKVIRNSLETSCHLYVADEAVLAVLEKHRAALKEYFLVSQCHLSSGAAPEGGPDVEYRDGFALANGSGRITITLAKSPFHRCPRCWKYDSAAPDALCEGCHAATA